MYKNHVKKGNYQAYMSLVQTSIDNIVKNVQETQIEKFYRRYPEWEYQKLELQKGDIN